MQFGNLIALSALLLAPIASAVPLDSETSPVSVLQKRSHGDCGGDPRCSVSQGQAIQDLVKQTFRDGVNYNRCAYEPIPKTILLADTIKWSSALLATML